MDWDRLLQTQAVDDQRDAALTDALGNITQFTTLVRGYYDAAIAQGFRRGEALALTIAFQTELLRANKPGGTS